MLSIPTPARLMQHRFGNCDSVWAEYCPPPATTPRQLWPSSTTSCGSSRRPYGFVRNVNPLSCNNRSGSCESTPKVDRVIRMSTRSSTSRQPRNNNGLDRDFLTVFFLEAASQRREPLHT